MNVPISIIIVIVIVVIVIISRTSKTISMQSSMRWCHGVHHNIRLLYTIMHNLRT